MEIVKLSIIDRPAWNSSYERQKNPPITPSWTMGRDSEEFKLLAQKVLVESKINNQYSLLEFLETKPTVARKPYDNERKQTGAIPKRIEIKLELSSGHILSIGEYPIYELTEPFSKLVELVREKGKQSFEGDGTIQMPSADSVPPPASKK